MSLAAGRHRDVDLLVGSNKDEGTFPFSARRHCSLWGSRRRSFQRRRSSGLARGRCVSQAIPGGIGGRSCSVAARRVPRRMRLERAILGCGSGPSRKGQSVPLLLHARATGYRRTAEPRRNAYDGDPVHVQQPDAALDRRRSTAWGPDVVVLGELRNDRQSERPRAAVMAGVRCRKERTADSAGSEG